MYHVMPFTLENALPCKKCGGTDHWFSKCPQRGTRRWADQFNDDEEIVTPTQEEKDQRIRDRKAWDDERRALQ